MTVEESTVLWHLCPEIVSGLFGLFHIRELVKLPQFDGVEPERLGWLAGHAFGVVVGRELQDLVLWEPRNFSNWRKQEKNVSMALTGREFGRRAQF